MNTIKILAGLTLCSLLIGLSACNNRLDVIPQQSIDEDQALSTPGNVLAALTGAYDGLAENDVWGGGQYLSELLADNGEQVWAGSFEEPEQVFQKSILVQNVFVENFWAESYEAINRCNNVLSAIEVLDAADQDRVEAEAKFIRGAIYFDLANLFGKPWSDGNAASNLAVPLATEPTRTIDETSEVSRSTVAQIYEQVIADLIFARDNLPEDNGILASTYAASALLSRVYLMQGRLAEAGDEANRVIESGMFSLVSDYASVFNQSSNTTEDIFTIEITSQDGDNDLNLYYAAPELGGRGDIEITGAHLDEYETGDLRLDLFYVDDNGIDRTGKWLDNASLDGNINIARLAEMYLTRAEARMNAGDATGAAADVNMVRERVGLSPLLAGELGMEMILKERKLELMFEGHLYRDSKRLRQDIGTLTYDADELVYPIPQREMDVNSNLMQNPGY